MWTRAPNTRSVTLPPMVLPWRKAARFDHVQWTWTIVGALAAIDVAWCAHAGLTIRRIGPAVAASAALWALSMIYRQRCRPLSDTAEIAALWIAFPACSGILSYLCATAAQPLQDPLFSAIDRELAFNWWAWHAYVLRFRLLNAALCAAYGSLAPQILLSVLYLPAIGRARLGGELLLLASSTALVCCAISALWPATGPSTEFSYIPHLMTLRAQGPWQFELFNMEGIVEMPSYHTILAILLTYAFRNTGVLGWSIAALNLVMLPAIPPIGGHYLADMLAGAVIAASAIGMVRWIHLQSSNRPIARGLNLP